MVLIPEIGVLALALWCLAAALAITVVVEWLINAMGGVPVIGSVIKAVLSPVAHAISYAVGLLEHGIDALIGAAWSTMARITEWLWSQFVAQSSTILTIAHLLGNQLYGITGLRSLVHRLERVYNGIEHGIKTLTREWQGIDKRVRALERSIAEGIGHDLRVTIKALERTLHTVTTKTIPAIEADVRTVEGEVTALGEWIKTNLIANTTDAITAAVAIGLSALGLGGLRCNTLLRSLANRGCGLWGGLENLLGLFIDTLILADLCQIIPETVAFFGVVEGALTGLISQAANAICASASSKWINPNVAPGPLPPVQAFDSTTLASGG